MKKLFAFLLACVCALALFGCAGAKGAFSHVREGPLLIPQENGRGVSISPLHP